MILLEYLDQRDNKTKGGIGGNRQCSVSAFTSNVRYAGEIFEVPELEKMSEDDYFDGIKNFSKSYASIFNSKNHRNYVNALFQKYKIPCRMIHETTDEIKIRTLIQSEGIPVTCSILISKFLNSQQTETHFVNFIGLHSDLSLITNDSFGDASTNYTNRNGKQVKYGGENLKYMLSGGTGMTYFDPKTIKGEIQ